MNNERNIRIAARCLMALIFIVAGIGKITGWAATVGYFTKLGIPAPEAVVALCILIEIGGGLALILGWKLPLVAIVLAVFTFSAAFIAHHFWTMEPPQQSGQMMNFLKNMAITGGFLLLARISWAKTEAA